MPAIVQAPPKPLIFHAWSIRGILDGAKTQTRRPLKMQPIRYGDEWEVPVVYGKKAVHTADPRTSERLHALYAPHKKGERIWVRESYGYRAGTNDQYVYRATEPNACAKWGNPLYMPRIAARLFLEITWVRIQPVQEITETDAMAEGVRGPGPGIVLEGRREGMLGYNAMEVGTFPTAREAFAHAWDVVARNGRTSKWADNPWCWAYGFKRVETL